MSVIVAKRNKSPIEFIDNARKISEIIPDRMNKLLRKMNKTFYNIPNVASKVSLVYYELPTRLSLDAYLMIIDSHIVYVRKGKNNTIERRISLLDNAIRNYIKLCKVMSILFKVYPRFIKPKSLANILDLINNEIGQLKVIINQTKKLKGSTEKRTA